VIQIAQCCFKAEMGRGRLDLNPVGYVLRSQLDLNPVGCTKTLKKFHFTLDRFSGQKQLTWRHLESALPRRAESARAMRFCDFIAIEDSVLDRSPWIDLGGGSARRYTVP
jgi:hypothetical protein